MTIFRFLAGAALALSLSGAARASDLGACTWERLPAVDREIAVAAYQNDPRSGAAALKPFDSDIQAQAAACGAGRRLPVFVIRTATLAEAMQVSMADLLQKWRSFDRGKLDAAWTTANPGVKACFYNYAAKVYHLTPPACPDVRTIVQLPQQLGIKANRTERPAARTALLYFTAKAESEYSDAVARHYQQGG